MAAAIGLRSGQSIVSAWSQPNSWQDARVWLDFVLWCGVFTVPVLLARIGAVRSAQKNRKYLPISQRLSAVLALGAWTTQAILFLIKPDYASYFIYVACMGLVVCVLVHFIDRDIVLLATALLSANVLFLGTLGRWIVDQSFFKDEQMAYLLFSTCAAILVGSSVYWLYQTQYKDASHVE